MSKVQWNLTDDNVALSYDGKFVLYQREDAKFSKSEEFIKNNDDVGLYNWLTQADKVLQTAYSKSTKDFSVIDNGLVKVGNDVLPANLSQRLLRFAEKGVPYQPLINFWKKLLKNPSMRAVNELFGCLDRNHHPLHPDGDFMAWKGLQDDYKDIHSGKFDNTPGRTNEMSRRDVDDDNVNSCSYGFHVGSYDYAKNFAQGKIVEVKVNPADVVAVPTDCNWQKMRVCKYTVVRDCTEFNSNEVVDDDDDYDYEEDICTYCGEEGCDGYCDDYDECDSCGCDPYEC